MKVDINVIKSILENKPAIHFGDYIPQEVVELIRSVPTSKADILFEKCKSNPTSEDREKQKFECEFKCSCCGSIVVERLSKTKLCQKDDLVCKNCKDVVEQQRRFDQEIEVIRHADALKARRRANTEIYINEYLNPDYEFDDSLKLWQKWELINCDIEPEIVAEYIKRMNYHEFLKTPYWKTVRDKKLKKAEYTCQVCGRNNVQLNIHHTTYSIRGYEHKNLDKLTCLCADCHNRHHKS